MVNIMKKLGLATAVLLAMTGAQAYQFEVQGQSEYIDNTANDKDFTGAVQGTYYFKDVDASKGPLAEAAFLNQASNVALAYSYGENGQEEAGRSRTVNHTYGVKGETYIPTKVVPVYASASYSHTIVDNKAGEADDNGDRYALELGALVAPNFLVAVGYTSVADQASLDAFNIVSNGVAKAALESATINEDQDALTARTKYVGAIDGTNMPIGPGRGSGAGSLVAYCLGITDIDPFRYGLIFERFLNPERVSMPDFDVDMDFDFRQDIIQHTRDLYHDENVGHIVTFGTLKPKNCLADVGRILGIPLSDVARLKECVPDNPKAKLKDCFTEPDEEHPDNGKLIPYKDDPAYKKLFELAFKLEGCIRNTGLHASGMVIGLTPLPDWAPVYKDAKTGETAVQYTMDIIEPCGLVKFDYLGLKTLSIIRYAEDIINRHKAPDEPEFICANVSETDEKTFDLFCRGDSVAIFQFESPGMQKILRDCQPRCIEELVALNALYRPGPLDYIPKYIEGKWKPETVKYPDDSLEDLLKETYGVMVYQEQVMKVAQIISGFSLGGADMLRRAMGKKKKEVLDAKKVDFVEGALKNGHSKEHAEEIFDIMVPFAGYGFNKSHAAAYSVLAYRTGYLKANRPAEYMAANLTNEITSTDTLPVYIEEARRMGIPVDPPDVNRSDINFDVVDGHIIFGLRGIKGMGTEAARQIVEERKKNGPYKTFVDFIDRCAVDKINKKAVEVLIKTGGFDNLDQNRATLMLNFERCIEYESKIMSEKNDKQGNLFEMAGIKDYADFEFQQVEDWPKMQKLNAEAELIGCFVSGHPLDEWKEPMEKFATINSKNFERLAKITHQQKETMKANKVPFKEIRNAGTKYIAIGMLKNLHEITTSKGSQMAFGKLEDFNDSIDLVFFPDTWAAVKTHIREDGVYAFSGKADLNQKGQPNFTVEGLEDFEKLELSSIKSIHIQIKPGTSDRQKLGSLEDLLYSSNGNCTVVFHQECSGKIWTLNTKLQTDCNKDFLLKIKDNLLVEDVWCE